jgi:hypothetical protein
MFRKVRAGILIFISVLNTPITLARDIQAGQGLATDTMLFLIFGVVGGLLMWRLIRKGL